jgi:hypothetical protein
VKAPFFIAPVTDAGRPSYGCLTEKGKVSQLKLKLKCGTGYTMNARNSGKEFTLQTIR